MKKLCCLLLIICLLSFTGCVNKKEKDIVKIIPDELFKGELKKIEPHLDLLTGYVDIVYTGEKDNLKLSYELWEKGKLLKVIDSLTISKFETPYKSSLSVSAKKIESDKFRVKSVLKGASSNRKFDLPSSYSYNDINLNSETIFKDSEDIIVWGLSGNRPDGSFTYYNDNIKKTLEAADFALVLKIKFE